MSKAAVKSNSQSADTCPLPVCGEQQVIAVLLYDGPLLCGFNVAIKG